MKKLLIYIGKHLTWVLILAYVSLWQFNHDLWKAFNAKVSSFFSEFMTDTKETRRNLKELKDDIKK